MATRFEQITSAHYQAIKIKNSTKCWICDNDYVENDVKVRDYFHIIDYCQYRDSAHRGCNVNLELNHEILVVFHNLKDYYSHLFMQELGKFNLKINVIPNGLEKRMNLTINSQSRFIDSFQFRSPSSDTLVTNLNKDNFKQLSQEFGNNIFDLAKQKKILSLLIYQKHILKSLKKN